MDKISPLFSIIIPVYNVENFIIQTVSSVLSQTFKNYEIILVDDGSTDNSAKICFDLACQVPFITLIRKSNGGLSDARNSALRIAQGEYIIFLDGDDYWDDNNALNGLANVIYRNHYPDLILHPYKILDLREPHKGFIYRKLDIEGLTGIYQNDFSNLISKNIYVSNVWTKIVKREIILNNNLFFEYGVKHEDSTWSFDLAKYIKNYAIYANDFYVYHMARIGNITGSGSINQTEDVISHIFYELNQLEHIKESYFYLYQGCFNYLSREIDWLNIIYNALSEENKSKLSFKFTECTNLFNFYATRDFTREDKQ